MQPNKRLYEPIPDDLMIELAKFRFAYVDVNLDRVWDTQTKTNEQSYLLTLALGAKKLFYDDKLKIETPKTGSLRRAKSVSCSEDFIEVIQYEWNTNQFFEPHIPESLESMAQIYKYIVRNIAEPHIKEDTFYANIEGIFSSTFGVLNRTNVEGFDSETKQGLIEQRLSGYKHFRTNAKQIKNNLMETQPQFNKVTKDNTKYSLNEQYNDMDWRRNEINLILSGKKKYSRW